MQHTYFVPRNTTKLTTRGGTSPDGVEMTLIRERKSTRRLGTRLDVDCRTARGLYRSGFTCKSRDPFREAILSRCDCYQCPVGYAHDAITLARKSVLCRSSPAGEKDTGHCMLLPIIHLR